LPPFLTSEKLNTDEQKNAGRKKIINWSEMQMILAEMAIQIKKVNVK
jgi:hypothetical protein